MGARVPLHLTPHLARLGDPIEMHPFDHVAPQRFAIFPGRGAGGPHALHIGSPLLDERILFGAHLVLVLVLKRPIAPLQRLALFQGRFPWGFECTGDEPVRAIDRLIPALRSLPVILRWLELQSPLLTRRSAITLQRVPGTHRQVHLGWGHGAQQERRDRLIDPFGAHALTRRTALVVVGLRTGVGGGTLVPGRIVLETPFAPAAAADDNALEQRRAFAGGATAVRTIPMGAQEGLMRDTLLPRNVRGKSLVSAHGPVLERPQSGLGFARGR